MDNEIIALSELPVVRPVTRAPVLFSSSEVEVCSSGGAILFLSIRNDNSTGIQKVAVSDGPFSDASAIARLAIPAGQSKEIVFPVCGLPFFNSLHVAGLTTGIVGSVTFRQGIQGEY